MSRGIFVDTSGWKALIDARDAFHQLVQAQFHRCRAERILLETTDAVISETLTLLRLRRGLGHETAVKFGQMVQTSQAVQITFIAPELFQRGWEIFQRYHDKMFSFVDCLSFAVMEKKQLKEAIATDAHFAQYGFQSVP